MWTKNFWKQAAERAVKTFAQGAGALLVGEGLGLVNVDWATVGSVAGLAAVASILTSVASAPFGEQADPSMVSR